MWLDNIKLFEANVTLPNPDDYIRFEYNATQLPKTIPLTDKYIDVKSNYYTDSLTLQPYTSVILLKLASTVSNRIRNYLLSNKQDITIYPNPTSTTLNFQSTLTDLSKIIIYDVTGRKILDANYSQQLDVSLLDNGIYFAKIITKNSQVITSQKVVIQH